MHILIMILLISILIIIHELGHYFVAKLFKIQVDKFAIGLPFGPTLFEKKIGETTFLIHACLFGGYVSFPDDEKNNDIPKDSPILFNNKPLYQRACVVSAGVLANFLCAILLVLFVAFYYGKLPTGMMNIYVDKIIAPKEASINYSGIKYNDKIYKINGNKVTAFYQINKVSELSKEQNGFTSQAGINQKIKEIKNLNNNKENFQKGDVIILPQTTDEETLNLTKNQLIGIEKIVLKEIELSDLQKDLRSKVQYKEKYIAENDITINDIACAISDTKKPIFISVIREGKEIKLNPIYSNKDGKIGLQSRLEEVLAKTENVKTGIINSWDYLYDNTEMMLLSLFNIFTGKVPYEDLHGIVAITKIGGNVIENQGLSKGLLLTAIISLNLAIVNLLPFPALDGGHLFFMIIEKIRGRAIAEKTLEKISAFGFYFLIILMVLILYNDIVALITQKI